MNVRFWDRSMGGGVVELGREEGDAVLGREPARFIGPGGQEAVKTAKGDMLVYHYYDGDAAGAAKLQLSPILWSADGWPELGPSPQ
jgi:arabinan endo-1,5-alpha-L-arabinosidase